MNTKITNLENFESVIILMLLSKKDIRTRDVTRAVLCVREIMPLTDSESYEIIGRLVNRMVPRSE